MDQKTDYAVKAETEQRKMRMELGLQHGPWNNDPQFGPYFKVECHKVREYEELMNKALQDINRAHARAIDLLHSGSMIEVACVNPSVSDHMKHWESRAETAEKEVDHLRKQVAKLLKVNDNLEALLKNDRALWRGNIEVLERLDAIGENFAGYERNVRRQIDRRRVYVDVTNKAAREAAPRRKPLTEAGRDHCDRGNHGCCFSCGRCVTCGDCTCGGEVAHVAIEKRPEH